MIKKIMILSLLLCVALLFSTCGGGKSEPAPAGDSSSASQPAEPGKTAPVPAAASARTGILKISDMANAWNELFNQNEKAINDFQGMPIMGLVTPPLAFAAAVQFDMLNLNNQDGRYEGKLMLTGYQGFMEKAGAMLRFGYDDTLKKDGFGPAAKTGDRVAANGSLALDKGHFTWETFSERSGKKINRSTTEFKRLGDGSMICLALSGQAYNFRGDEEAKDSGIFLHNGAGRYDFVIVKGGAGPEFKNISFADQGDLTKEQALELFKAAGYTIEKSGGIQGGVLVLDSK